ncbi:alpha/beta fold hydrolase [Methylobacterium planeticum]|uniref:Alpha/beta hydrolase n=1 Tax=Methylobacterium planeticum TaxID=2615211 RepID=A0A6N6MQA9_9HYPH|nr:alpha/beta hydrolase [Methylobacterium planeticum]KAB1073762.1 alpha/beta hydrolase [Methylobacterium planeticum]
MTTPPFEPDPSTFLPGFTISDLRVGNPPVRIRTAVSPHGDGVPVLLLHGHPQTHATWHAVAPVLVAGGHPVVAMDLRGYGDSEKPASAADHAPYSKRAMAADARAVMERLGYPRFAVVGHDRGGRVAHRLVLDHPEVVARLAVLDIAPTLTMYERTDRAFATRYFWWFFLIQPEPLPERMIGADPEAYLRHHLRGQSATPGIPEERLIREYLRAYRSEGAIHAICEDYRAAAGIDLEHDRQDDAAGRRIRVPLLALWGERGTVGALYDVLATWRAKADRVEGAALPCGHLVQEEAPDDVLARLLPFLRG